MRLRALAALALVVLALGLADACWLETRVLLLRDDVRIDLPSPRVRLVHLSDLHIRDRRPLLGKLLEQVRSARPDVVVVSGDLIRDVPDLERLERYLADTAAFFSSLRRIAPVVAVQGHSEHQGQVISRLDDAGVQWLSNEGRRIGPGGRLLLLGVNQQVGHDDLAWQYPNPFRPMQSLQKNGEEWHYGARWGEPTRNFYAFWDPAPSSLADEGGPLTWSGYEVLCDTWIDHEDAGSGVALHSRYLIGEDRMYRLRRVPAENGQPGSFVLVAHGTTLVGEVDTRVDPEPGRWYRMRVRTEVLPEAVRLLARVWPANSPEPKEWQARAEDRSRFRVQSGTIGLWAWGGGTVLYRNLKVTGAEGEVLLEAPLTSRTGPSGFRKGARGTRLELALARSPWVPPGTPRIVLSHTPGIVLEASRRGLDAVLAGHTHGGQVRIPGQGALTTRDTLGAFYDQGRFEFPAPTTRGTIPLYINPGVGMSVLQIRFWCPPRFAVVDLGQGERAAPAAEEIETIEVSEWGISTAGPPSR